MSDDMMKLMKGHSQRASMKSGTPGIVNHSIMEVLRMQPLNLYEFIADYLEALLAARESAKVAMKVMNELISDIEMVPGLLEAYDVPETVPNIMALIKEAKAKLLRPTQLIAVPGETPEETLLRELEILGIDRETAIQAVIKIQAAYRGHRTRRLLRLKGDLAEQPLLFSYEALRRDQELLVKSRKLSRRPGAEGEYLEPMRPFSMWLGGIEKNLLLQQTVETHKPEIIEDEERHLLINYEEEYAEDDLSNIGKEYLEQLEREQQEQEQQEREQQEQEQQEREQQEQKQQERGQQEPSGDSEENEEEIGESAAEEPPYVNEDAEKEAGDIGELLQENRLTIEEAEAAALKIQQHFKMFKSRKIEEEVIEEEEYAYEMEGESEDGEEGEEDEEGEEGEEGE